MRQTTLIPAGENEKFAPASWDSQIGKIALFKVGDSRIAEATVVSAVVAEDGSSVALTVEISDPPLTDAIAGQLAGHFSFAVPKENEPWH